MPEKKVLHFLDVILRHQQGRLEAPESQTEVAKCSPAKIWNVGLPHRNVYVCMCVRAREQASERASNYISC